MLSHKKSTGCDDSAQEAVNFRGVRPLEHALYLQPKVRTAMKLLLANAKITPEPVTDVIRDRHIRMSRMSTGHLHSCRTVKVSGVGGRGVAGERGGGGSWGREGRFECGGQCRRWEEDVGCDMHCKGMVCDNGDESEIRECVEWLERGR